MSVDIPGLVDTTIAIIKLAFLLFIAYRAFEMGRGLASPLYRSRAYWTGGLVLAGFLATLNFFIPVNGYFWFFVTFVPIFALFATVAAFVDRTVSVAKETDFFHRDIVAWNALRVPSIVIGVVTLPVLFLSSLFLPQFNGLPPLDSPILPLIGFMQFFVFFPLVFGYWVVALVIGARRTPDRTLKRHIIFLGIGLALFAVNFLQSSITADAFPFDLVDDAVSLTSVYLLYLAVMSLTPLGRVEKGSD